MLSRGFFEVRAVRLIAAAIALVAAMAAGLLVAPGVAHAYEVHVSITGAGRVYETTPANLVGKECSPQDWSIGIVSPQETPTGVVGAECWPGSPTGDYGWGWTVRYVAEAKPGYSFVQWQSDGSPNPVRCDTGRGVYRIPYTGSACQFQTYNNLQVQAVFADTTNPAMTSLRGPSQPVNGPATFTFSAAADPTFSKFECRVAGVHEWQDCSSGQTEDPSSSGNYTFEVRAVDWSGNRSATSSWDWTVDKTGPAASIIDGPPPYTNSGTATFTFTGAETGGGYRCSIDTAPFSACSSGQNFPVANDGTHTFRVQASDNLSNWGATASRTWTVDTTPPTLNITSGPPDGGSYAPGSTQTWAFTASDALSGLQSVQCKVEAAGSTASYGACSGGSSSHSVSNLPVGSYRFSVLAIDRAGNTSEQTRSFSIAATPPPDTTKPTISGMSPRHRSIIRDTTPIIRANVKDNAPLAKANVKLYVNGRLILASKYTYTPSTGALVYRSPKLALGKKTVKIVATDAARNVGIKSWYFTIR